MAHEGDAAGAIDVAVLVKRASDGDQSAWDALVDRYSGLLWSIARGFRLDRADAADAVQVAWLRLVEHLPRVRDPERVGAWLATTVRRECLQQLATAKRRGPATGDDVLVRLPDDAAPVDARLLADERDGQLWSAFERMPERCRTLLRILMADPPPTYQEVSAALDMPVGSIGPTRGRCLDQLRNLLRDEESEVTGDR